MAKRRNSRRRRVYYVKRRVAGMTIPLAPIAGIVAMPGIRQTAVNLSQGNIQGAMQSIGWIAGLDSSGKFSWQVLQDNMLPLLAGFAAHKIASTLGVNRALGAAKVPFLRV